ncbi:YtxH domain-containing protein [Aquimarina sp. ERC-38]|uniref:YtxH domain-containing protein n=1 Tax=Aquimarina sp. ERC-38 TaxID=2949996 RepID=UPI0022471313|nr:YtxH domain-containing protein [Aquimarina sp. ERC-38]UZO81116.1 YtxH domain-containing protein [Aquimarina sp. ERC-38]
MSDSGSTFLGLLAGTAIGAALGILYAPDKGINTRRRLNEEALLRKDQLANEAAHLRDQLATTVASKKQTLDARVDSIVQDASYKADELITTLERKLSDLKAKNRKLQKNNTGVTEI